jgi:putative two-component system response regulator
MVDCGPRIAVFCSAENHDAIRACLSWEGQLPSNGRAGRATAIGVFRDIEALCQELLTTTRAGVALVDSGTLELPDRDLSRIVDCAGTTPVVVLLRPDDRILQEVAFELGVFDFASLPPNSLELRVRLRAALQVNAQHRQLRSYAQQIDELARLRKTDLEDSRIDVLLRLGKAAEYRDRDTGYHVFRVGLYARELAASIGLPAEQTRTLLLAAPLHDIGKIGIPDQILLKQGRLTTEEWRIMRRHSEIGARILREAVIGEETYDGVLSKGVLRRSSLQEQAAHIAMTHHERWDGSGYPNGLKGEDIPIMGRIVALADVYDAVTSRRAYKRSLSHDDARELVKLECGSHFDPAVCTAFSRVQDAFADINSMYGGSSETISN